MDTLGPNSLLFALVAGAFLCPLLAGCDDDGLGPGGNATISEPFDLQRDAAGRIAFRVVGINGGIAVTGVSQGESFQVTGFRRVQGCSLERADALIEELEVRVSETAEEIVVQTLQPSSTSPCSLVVDYELEVPERLFGRISVVNGGVAVTGLHEGVSVTSVNGAAVLEDVEGDATVRLTNGAIEADVAIEGDEEIDLLTVNGTIDLTVPGGTHARLSASLTNGTITVTGLTLTDPATSRTTLTGILGNGEGEIVVHTTNGNITLTGR